jgi:UDP-N-acetylglucosamine transferase subunit ALG13
LKLRQAPETENLVGSHDQGRQSRRLRICLAGSGGGHVRQLLDLEPVWSAHDSFFLTEDTALGQSVAEKHRTHFVTHVAAGQAKLGAPGKMLIGAFRNFFQSAKAILKERPDVVLSTGAGAMFFGVLWARLLGAKIVVIDSFARFDRPSLFARIAAPLAHRKVVQSKALSSYFPDAEVFDPLRMLEGQRPAKQPLLFATVGATLPFDRLVNSVANLKARGLIPERVIAQVGIGGAKPPGVEAVETLRFEEIQQLLKEADIVVCHGGTGSLITALREGCRVVSMPRLFELGEHYDNHQAEITEAFVKRGLIGMAKSEDELMAALEERRAKPPMMATTDPSELKSYLERLLREWSIGR